jgi:hypothetical protein
MLQRLWSMFLKEAPAPTNMHTIPGSPLDVWSRELIMTYGLIIDERLDVAKLEETICTLITSKFPKAGARIGFRNGVRDL